MFELSAAFKETVASVHGASGRTWLSAVSGLIADLSQRWSLQLEAPFTALSFNLVIPGKRADGLDVVLKLGVPNHELASEAAALRLYAGRGAIRLLEYDGSAGALLLERVLHGRSLAHSNADNHVLVAANAMRSIWREPPAHHNFRSLEDWFKAFERLRATFKGGTGPFETEIIADAEATFKRLSSSTETRIVLHGDLHHENILESDDGRWTVIDPKGILGDAAFEPSTFIHNHLPLEAGDKRIREIIDERITRFATVLDISRERIADWASYQRVLSTLWSLEDSCPWQAGWRLVKLMADK